MVNAVTPARRPRQIAGRVFAITLATLAVAWLGAQVVAITAARSLERPKAARAALFRLLGRIGWTGTLSRSA